ncbi:hypothetical protein FACS1894177_07250 [Bacteroidia bacterium]|nr:hypothetical protein FACS1894177_07250 [Bacteroidia bacterium]
MDNKKFLGLNKFNKRAFVSIALLILFALLFLSAVAIQIIEINHRGSFAEHACTFIHVICGIVFTTIAIFHIAYNWKALIRYIKG